MDSENRVDRLDRYAAFPLSIMSTEFVVCQECAGKYLNLERDKYIGPLLDPDPDCTCDFCARTLTKASEYAETYATEPSRSCINDCELCYDLCDQEDIVPPCMEGQDG